VSNIDAMQQQQNADSFVVSMRNYSLPILQEMQPRSFIITSSCNASPGYKICFDAAQFSAVLQAMIGSEEDPLLTVQLDLPDEHLHFIAGLLECINQQNHLHKQLSHNQRIMDFIKNDTHSFIDISFSRVLTLILFFDIPVALDACIAMQESFLLPQTEEEKVLYNRQLVKLARLTKSTASLDQRYSMCVGSVALWQLLGSLLYPGCMQYANVQRALQGIVGYADGENYSPEQKKILKNIERIILGAYSVKYPQLYRHLLREFIACSKNVCMNRLVTCSPNSTMIAAILGNKKDIQLIALPSGAIVRELFGHCGNVNALAFNTGSSTLLLGTDDGAVRLWGIADNSIRVFVGHHGPVLCIDCSQSREIVASGSSDATIRLWNMHTGQSRILTGHSDSVTKVLCSPSGERLVSESDDGTIRLWDMTTGECIKILVESSQTSISKQNRVIALSIDGSKVALVNNDNAIGLWNCSDGMLVKMLVGHTHTVNALRFGEKDTMLMSGSIDGEVRLWNLMYDFCTYINAGDMQHTGYVSACSTDMKIFIIANQEGLVQLKSLINNDVVVYRLINFFDAITHIDFSPDGSLLFMVLRDQIIKIHGCLSLSHALSQTVEPYSVAGPPCASKPKAVVVRIEPKKSFSLRGCLFEFLQNWMAVQSF